MNTRLLTAVVISAACMTEARADLALAELGSMTLHISGPGLGFLADGPNGESVVTRDGKANGVPKLYTKFWRSSFFSDNNAISDAQNGANYYIGNVTSTAPGSNLQITLGRVRAEASGLDASAFAELKASVYFDVIGIPPAGSTITVTTSMGLENFIEQSPPNAHAFLSASVGVTKFIGLDTFQMGGVSTTQFTPLNPLTLSSFTIDLSDHLVDPLIRFDVSLFAIAEVRSVPTPASFALLGLGGITSMGKRARRKRTHQIS